MCDQWKMLQCWWRTGNSPSFFVPTPGNFPYPEVKKVLMHGGQAQMEGGGGEGGALGAASIDQRIIGSTSSLIPPRSWTSKPGQNLLFKIKRFKMRTGNKIQAWPVHLPKTPCAPCFLRRCLGTTGPWEKEDERNGSSYKSDSTWRPFIAVICVVGRGLHCFVAHRLSINLL